ncbi:MAG: hypothetical protein K9L30_13375 [Desulfobacterales bacterium]|nr:hypothetical protein [Desulfobacterales bacterium]
MAEKSSIKIKTNCFNTISFSNLWPSILLIAIFCLAVTVRLDYLPNWLEQPDRAFYSGEPLLTSVDGYYYLSLSQDLLDGTYNTVNEMRGVPDHPLRPSIPPLFSWLAASIVRLTGLSLNWVGAMLPVFLGTMIIFPVYFFGKTFNGRFMGCSAAVFTVLAYSYVLRSRIGFFDTDCLNVTLVLCIGLFYYGFAISKRLSQRMLHFFCALLSTFTLYMWWDQAPAVVLVMSCTYLFMVLGCYYRPSRKEGYVFYAVLSGIAIYLLVSKGLAFYVEIFNQMYSKFTYISKVADSTYPNIGTSISEQQQFDFQKIIKHTTNTVYIFILSLSGLLGLLIKRRRDCIILAVPALIGFLGIFYASRFLVFLVPVLALGLGFFLAEFWNSGKRSFRLLAVLIFFLLTVSYHFHSTYNITTWPFIKRNDVHALVQVKKNTPDNAVIWSTWGKGYLINYWAQRATISDGAIHSGRLSHFLYWPLAQDDPRLAANFMKFFVVRGQTGIGEFRRRTGLSESDALEKIREILSAEPLSVTDLCKQLPVSHNQGKGLDPIDWFAFFFPSNQDPVFLFLHRRMLPSAYWWYWYGTWDIGKQEGIHTSYSLFTDILLGENDFRTIWGKHVDFQSGQLSRGEYTQQLSEIYDQDGTETTRRTFSDGEDIMFVQRKLRTAVLMDEILWNSIFNRLFIRSDHENGYFTPFFLDNFNAQVWQVR